MPVTRKSTNFCQLTHESAQRRTVTEARRALQDQFDIAEKRIIGLEGELAAAREKLALLEDEKRSLQIAVDQALNETARLTRRLTESENTLTATRVATRQGRIEFCRSLCRTWPIERGSR